MNNRYESFFKMLCLTIIPVIGLGSMLGSQAAEAETKSATPSSLETLVRTVQDEVARNKPQHDKDETDPAPINALSAKAYPAAESIASALQNGPKLTRTEALYIVRVVNDLVSVDPSAAGAMLMADFRKKPAMIQLLTECRIPRASDRVNAAPSTSTLDHQESLSSAGIHLVTHHELCDFKDLMMTFDNLEKNGNG